MLLAERIHRTGAWIAAHYGVVMAGGLSLCLGLMAVSLALAPFELLLPEFSPVGSMLAARETARLQAFHGLAQQSDVEVQSQQSYVTGRYYVIFRARDGDSLLTPALVARMKALEDQIIGYAGYETLCLRQPGTDPPACQVPASVVGMAYASHRSLGGDALITVPDRLGPASAEPSTDLFAAVAGGSTWVLQLLNTAEPACAEPPHACRLARTMFSTAGPLSGFKNLQERKMEQQAQVYAFLEGLTRDVLVPFAANASEPLQIAYTGDELWRYELNVYIYRDAMMTTGSFVLLFSYFALHTQSLVVATLAVATIVLAFPLSYFIYRTLCGCPVNGLTVMAMFVVLGVAADDIFIVVDNWRRSRFSPREGGLGRRATAAQRGAFVLSHAAPAMAITSATTISAFMTSALSTIPTIRLFGFFAAIVVGANYLLVCTFFLAAMSFWEHHVRGRDWLLRKRVRAMPARDLSLSVETGLWSLGRSASGARYERNDSLALSERAASATAAAAMPSLGRTQSALRDRLGSELNPRSRSGSLARLSRPPSTVTFAMDLPSQAQAQGLLAAAALAPGSAAAGQPHQLGGAAAGGAAEPAAGGGGAGGGAREVFSADELAVLTGARGELGGGVAEHAEHADATYGWPSANGSTMTMSASASSLADADADDGARAAAARAQAAVAAAAAAKARARAAKPATIPVLPPPPPPQPAAPPPSALADLPYGAPYTGPPELSRRASSAEDFATYNMGAPQRFLDRFFPQTFVPFADAHRRQLLAFFAVLIVCAGYVASHFELEDKASMMLPKRSNIETFREWSDAFPPAEEGGAVRIHFLWGVVGIDRTRIDATDPDDHGRVLFDEGLDIWQDQASICAFCDALLSPAVAHWAAPPTAPILDCPMTIYRDYRLARNLSWPIASRSTFYARLAEFLQTPEGWAVAGRVGTDESGERVRWLNAALLSSLAVSQHGQVLHEHYAFWEEHARAANARANFSSPLLQTADPWKQMATLDSLASTAVVGIACSLAFATSCMLAVTGEWRLTLFATATILAIVVTLVAAYVLMGRTLGFMESVNLAIVSGLAVDYTLHIAHLYQHSERRTRFERVQESMAQVGISIFSGAATTLLASSMLFCAYIKMSQAFGATIFLSILFSFVYALGLFVPLLLEFGPLPQRVKGHTGDLDDSGDDGNFEPAGNGGADWQHQPMLDSSYFDSADHSETMHTPPEMSPRPVHGAASNGVATANGLASRPARSSAVEQY